MSRQVDNESTTIGLADDPELKRPDGTLYETEFWGIGRHELIAGLAEELLTDRARAKVTEILTVLGPVGLPDLAGWADAVKRMRPQNAPDAETATFLRDTRNKSNDVWHFVNLPLDAGEYDRLLLPTFTRDDDVVQMIQASALVLRGRSDRFGPVNALRLIVHLVGDLHQPIHVSCGFIDKTGPVAKIVREPDAIVAGSFPHDKGGNAIILPTGGSGTSLHSYWDGRLGGSNPLNADPPSADVAADPPEPGLSPLKRRFVQKLMLSVDRDEVEAATNALADPVAPEAAAATWATDSLAAARSAYQSLEITGPNGNNFKVSWEGKAQYDQRCKPIVAKRLATAGQNLAALLNAFWH